MSLRVTNTLTSSTEPFEPLIEGEVSMYVCGPTVQSAPHVGHGRSAVAFDVIRRYLAYRGFDVNFVRNITDVEDKIIAAAAETGETTDELAARVSGEFAETFERLAVLEPDIEPKATEHITEMLEMIERLIDRGLAYPTEAGDVYFSVRMLESYGRLSGRRVDEMMTGTREIVGDLKHDPLDFALWKASKPGEPTWDSPWGPGRPGWHIECSAMAEKYLGKTFDIHGGGSDLIFPHHENEIAQSEGANGQTFARYWLHNGMVNLGGEKMAKSTGHVIDLKTAIEQYGGAVVRLFYLRAHYRSPLEFNESLLEEARSALGRARELLDRVETGGVSPDRDVMARFDGSMDDDFNTPDALAVLFETVRTANKRLDQGLDAASLAAAVGRILEVLGIDLTAMPIEGGVSIQESGDVAAGTGTISGVPFTAATLDALNNLATEYGAGVEPNPIDALLARRTEARATRDFSLSDEIRDRLWELGITVKDGPDGSTWHRR